MKKAKVIAKFRDKYTGEINEKGSTIEVTEARFNEILAAGKFIKEIKEPRKTKAN